MLIGACVCSMAACGSKKEEKKNTQSLEDYEKACEEYYDRTYGKSWRTAMGYLD